MHVACREPATLGDEAVAKPPSPAHAVESRNEKLGRVSGRFAAAEKKATDLFKGGKQIPCFSQIRRSRLPTRTHQPAEPTATLCTASLTERQLAAAFWDIAAGAQPSFLLLRTSSLPPRQLKRTYLKSTHPFQPRAKIKPRIFLFIFALSHTSL